MKQPKLILDHINDPDSFAYHENKLTKLSKAMAVAMLATGMSRLSTKDDFMQFFIRMGLFYKEEGFISNFFARDEITCFLFDGSKVKASVDQIFNYKGILLESGFPNSTFEQWMREVNSLYLILKVMKIKRTTESDLPYKDLIQYYASETCITISETDIKNAQLMADIIFNEADESIFSQ